MAHVNTDSLRSISGEITNIVNTLKSAASITESTCDSLVSYGNSLKGFNGQKVTESIRNDTIVSPSDSNILEMHYYYNTWKTDDGGIVEAASQLKNYTSEILSIVDGIAGKAGAIDSIAATLDSYINSVEATLGIGTADSPFKPDSSLLSLAGLALGREGVKMSNLYLGDKRLTYEEFKATGLADTQLTFVKQDDGSYVVYSNGKKTEYSATKMSIMYYQKTLMEQTGAKLGYGKNSPAGGNKSTTGEKHAESGFNTADKIKMKAKHLVESTTVASGASTFIATNKDTNVTDIYDKNTGKNIIKKYDKEGNLETTVTSYNKSNDEHIISSTTNEKTGETVTTYDASKREDGMSKQITRLDRSSEVTYDSNKNPDGMSKSITKVDGSTETTYDVNSKNNTSNYESLTYEPPSGPEKVGKYTVKYSNQDQFSYNIIDEKKVNGTFISADGTISYKTDSNGNVIK